MPNFDGVPHYSADESEPVLFYGGPFSNFVGGPFKIVSQQPWGLHGQTYKTIEHFFQASKGKTLQAHRSVAHNRSPWSAKSAGRRLAMREDWDEPIDFEYYPRKFYVMLHGLRVKFAEPEFRQILIDTGDRLIAEDSPTDFIWGIRDDEGGWTGQNLLGKGLMIVRHEHLTST